MNLGSLAALTGTQSKQNIQRTSNRVQAAIAQLISGSKQTKASDDIASLSIASQLQASVSGLKQISTNLAQASSLTQVADGGVEQIQSELQQLKDIAQQASSGALNADNRAALTKQFNQIIEDINRIAKNTSFNGQKLLNGDVSGDNSLSLDKLLSQEGNNDGSLSISDLSTSALFDGKSLSLSSGASAQQAFAVLGDALNKTLSVRADIGAFRESTDFAAANIDSVINNAQAARAELADADFLTSATDLLLGNVQQKASIAIAAQGNRLSPALLSLIG